jgi:uncharacterized protein (DUF1330 family)
MATYLIGHITVKDSDLWQVYITGVQKSLVPFTAEVVFRGQRAKILAGEHSFDQCVVIKFENQAALQEWYNSKTYQGLMPTRDLAADVVIISYESRE